MSAGENIRRLVNEGVEPLDEEVLNDMLAPELDVVGSDETYSREQVIESMGRIDAALSDLSYEVREVWEGDDGHAAHIGLSGTFDAPYRYTDPGTGETGEVEPTGESVSGARCTSSGSTRTARSTGW
ncbi:hypothetical protein [Halosegnis marinus]|uniref:hypothetical protein n=1 Tax=Halosegnis marinus TaxID=3034023 RepID=UPI00360CD358